METCCRIFRKLRAALGITGLMILLTACGGGGGGSSADTITDSVSGTVTDTSSPSSGTSSDDGGSGSDTGGTGKNVDTGSDSTDTGSNGNTGNDSADTGNDGATNDTGGGAGTGTVAGGGNPPSSDPGNTDNGGDGGSGGDDGSGGTVDVPPPPPPPVLGSTSLSWQAPVERTDGEPLSASEIGGYRIYYGTASGDYTYSIDVNDATATSYVITDLPLDDYYFVLTTIDSDGRESGYSNEAVKQVQL